MPKNIRMHRSFFTGLLILLACLVVLPASHVQASMPMPNAPSRVEVVFVLDTTGSMSGLIQGAKTKIWSIANMIVDQNPHAKIYIGLVGYRDIGDTYVTKHFPLTTDIQGVYKELLTFRADGGGDTPESVNEALDVAVSKLGWSNPSEVESSRILFLVGDAPPHMDYKQDRKYPEIIAEAGQRGIIVNTVQAGTMSSTTKVWKEIAKLGKGEYMAIPQDGGRVVVIETPYDSSIRDIQIRINKTIVPYGSMTQQNEVSEKARLYESAPRSASADMASFVNKSGNREKAVTGAGDLVADAKNDTELLGKLKKDELPENMSKMSAEEQKKYLESIATERSRLTDDLAEQIQKRDAFIRDQETEAPPDSFDSNVKKTLTEQIKK